MRKLRGEGDLGGLVFGAIVLGVIGLAGFGGYELWHQHSSQEQDACYWQVHFEKDSVACLIDRPLRQDEALPGCITTDALNQHRVICSAEATDLAAFAQKSSRRICGLTTLVCRSDGTPGPFESLLAAGRVVGVDCDHIEVDNAGSLGWVAILCDRAVCKQFGDRWRCEKKDPRR